jgi:transcriptional regulator
MMKKLIRNNEVLRLRREGKTFQDIASELGITRQRAWQIANRDKRGRKKKVRIPVHVAEKIAQGALIISNAYDEWAKEGE